MRLLEQKAQRVAAPPERSLAHSFLAMAPPTVLVAPVAPTVPTTSGKISSPDGQLSPEERRDLVDRLTRFRQFDMPHFSGQSLEPWEAES